MHLDLVPDPMLAVTGPAQVHPRVLRVMDRIVDHRSPHFHRLYAEVVEGLRRVFKTSGDVYLLTASGTGAVEAMVMNFVRRGDRVVVPVFGTFGRRLVNHLRRVGAEVIEVGYPMGSAPTLEDLKARVEALGVRDFDVFATVYNETNPGTAFRDLPRAARWARSMGALVLVDNVSGLGGDWFEVDGWGIDVAVSSSQKCLAAPPVMSFVAVASDEARRRLEGIEAPSIYFDLKIMSRFAERMETPFTPSVNYMFALREALSIIVDEVGLDRWIKWHVDRGRAIFNAVSTLGYEPFVKDDGVRSTTVLSFNYPRGVDPAAFRDFIYRLGISISDAMDELRGRIFRIGNMGFLTKRDVVSLVSVLALAARRSMGKVGDIVEALSEAVSYGDPFEDALGEISRV